MIHGTAPSPWSSATPAGGVPVWPQAFDPLEGPSGLTNPGSGDPARLAQGTADAARAWLEMGHHPLAWWTDPQEARPWTNAWTVALLASSSPEATSPSAAWCVLRQDMVRRLRRMEREGKRAVVAGWAHQRWGWGPLLSQPPGMPLDREALLIDLYDTLETFLLGAPGDFPVHERAVWDHPHGPGYSHTLDPDQRGFAMEHFQVRAMLHELARVGNPAAWAVPVLAQRWRDPAWWSLALRDEAMGQPPHALLERATATGQNELGRALQQVTAGTAR